MHGVQNVAHADDPRTPEVRKVPIIYELPASIPTLAEVLREAGFTTLGLTDGGNVNPAHGFYRGFDVYTKGLSGAEVFDAIREIEPDVAIIVASGYSRESVSSELLARGRTHFVQKPFDANQLLAAVRRLLADR